MINVDDVLAVIRTVDVLDAYGARYHDEPQIRLRECPQCRARSRREAIVVERATGKWIHHGHGARDGGECQGGVLDLVAAYEGLDRARDFRRVLEAAARIAGLDTSLGDDERARIREARDREQAAYARARAAEREHARVTAAATWDRLARRHVDGEAYLADRGLRPDMLERVVRYADDGSPTLPLRDLLTGEIVGLQARRCAPRARKIHTSRGAQVAGSALHGRLTDLDPEGVDVAILVEGLADVLAAHLAWPGCAIYGAPGADQIATIARSIAPRVRDCRGWLLLTVDNDDEGVEGAAAAIVAAEQAGLVLDRDLHLVDLGQHHDLADAWRAGWRYRWPGMPS